MYCSNCGKEILNNSKYCQHCGSEIPSTPQAESQQPNIKQGKVIIHSYEEVYGVNPNVKIYKDGELIASLPKANTFEYSITEPTTLTFKCSIRTARVTVYPNSNTEIRLMFDRFSGKLLAICNEQKPNDPNNYVNQQNYDNTINAQKASDGVWLKAGGAIACIAVIVILLGIVIHILEMKGIL